MPTPDGKSNPQPVLVEATEEREPQKKPTTVLKEEIKQGLEEARRPASGLLISGLAAGLELGFSVLAMTVLLTLDGGTLHPVVREVLLALAYSVGYCFVILGSSELFTEHTSLAVFPVLNRDSSVVELLRLWGLIYVANLVGAALFALLLAYVGPGLGLIDPAAFGEVGRRLVGHSGLMLLLSGVLTGWLMGLLSWLVSAARETTSQLLLIVLVTSTIGFAHLHHAIAGSIEALTAIFAGQGVSWPDYLNFLVWSTLGNILGGVLLVAGLKYGHIRRSGHAPDQIKLKD